MLKKFLIKIANKLGFQVYRINLVLSGSWIKRLDIKTVIDIGANKGQFMQAISSILPTANIYSFEPLPHIFKELERRSKGKKVTTYNLALGNSTGLVEMNLSGLDESSSLLEMADLHKEVYKGSENISKVKVTLDKLDNVLASEKLEGKILLKIDVQGYEKNVLDGGGNILSKASVVLMESIFNPLYEGQWIFSELLEYMEGHNFIFHGFAEQGYSPESRMPMYADALFIRKEELKKLY